MTSLLNKERPPVFCPGCSHELAARALDRALVDSGLAGHQVCLVSDIGCSGLFDTFFKTHAFHGLHGRALTYATGLKLAQPEMTVVVTMGDGGLGIGGAHFLAACRRNLDLTLLVLNNFNFGMTGGQFSVTTPPEAAVASGFLNRIERPMDAARVAAGAGAGYVRQVSVYRKNLSDLLQEAIKYNGFSIVDIQGVCPGRYTKLNKLTPKMIEENLAAGQAWPGALPDNQRPEYGRAYRETAAAQNPAFEPRGIEARFIPPQTERQEVIILGSAGQRVITAGELLGLAGLTAGLNITQKNEYNITVLRGPSISELILSPEKIDFTGIERPTVVLALAPEGVARRRDIFDSLTAETIILKAAGVELPPHQAQVQTVDFKKLGLKNADWSLSALAALAERRQVLTRDMLLAALEERFQGRVLESSLSVLEKVRMN